VGYRGYMSYQQPPGYASYQQEYEVPEDEDDTCELELPSPLDLAHQVGSLSRVKTKHLTGTPVR
jgi:hypothetical protein